MEFLPTEIIGLFVEDAVTTACLLGVSKSLHELASASLRNAGPPSSVARLLDSETCMQSDLVDALILPAEIVRGFEHEQRRRRGGGHVRIFRPASVIPKIMRETNGVKGYYRRLHLRELRKSAKRKREEAKASANEDRKRRLEAGLAVLGLALRNDSSLCADYISGKKVTLEHVLMKMAHMHHLHNYTNGDYQQTVEQQVQLNGELYGFYPGIHRDMSNSVQSEKRFLLPKVLPWLERFASADAAIASAVAEGAVIESEQKRKKLDLRRRQGLAKRKPHK